MFLSATCTGVCLGTGCSDSSLCHTHFVSEQTWTCFDSKMTFCSPSQAVMFSHRRMSRGEVKCAEQVCTLVCFCSQCKDTNFHSKVILNDMNSCSAGALCRTATIFQIYFFFITDQRNSSPNNLNSSSSHPHANGRSGEVSLSKNISGVSQQNSVAALSLTT